MITMPATSGPGQVGKRRNTGSTKRADPQVSKIRPWTTKNLRSNSATQKRNDQTNSANARPKTSGNRSKDPASIDEYSWIPDVQPDDDESPWQPWSVTEPTEHDYEDYPPVDDNDGRVSVTSSVKSDDGDARTDDVIESRVEDEVGSENEVETPTDMQAWLLGQVHESDEYDTDLEEDFPPEPPPPVDPTGAFVYEESCQKQGIVPVSYLIRNMGDGNLRMRHHYLGGIGTRPLARALKNNTVCEEIDLSDNYVEGTGAFALADMLKENMFVVNLNISNNFIKSEGAAAFAEMLEANTTLKTLSLKGNQMSDSDAKNIAEAMKSNMSLSCLDLSSNSFGEQAGIYLAAGVAANIGLNDLDLSWNGIREKGAVAVGKAIGKNATLEILDISWNGFAEIGTEALSQSLRTNKSLKVLDISNNRMSTAAAVQFGQAIGKNKGLETLLMGLNPIGDEGMESVVKGISSNTTLKLVGLEDIPVSTHIQEAIKEITKTRDIMIMYCSGGPQQSKINQTILAVFDRFISENADRMEDLFNQMDKTKTGSITLEEFKFGLKDFGLRLTSRQLDLLLDELDADRSGTIELGELMAGANMVEHEKQKKTRIENEAQMYKDGLIVHGSVNVTNAKS